MTVQLSDIQEARRVLKGIIIPTPMIAENSPSSMHELVKRSGRALSNLSRTLKTMERYGLVQFDKGVGRTRIPKVMYTDIEFGLPIRGLRGAARMAKRTPSKRDTRARG